MKDKPNLCLCWALCSSGILRAKLFRFFVPLPMSPCSRIPLVFFRREKVFFRREEDGAGLAEKLLCSYEVRQKPGVVIDPVS